jgi:hypothetical protein
MPECEVYLYTLAIERMKLESWTISSNIARVVVKPVPLYVNGQIVRQKSYETSWI